ncbi:hypothetical protein PUN4_340019 [Paraburkholderia unamae]|nr:hypothetical protein PUN4_340019 [Paraburkholderia unamae]
MLHESFSLFPSSTKYARMPMCSDPNQCGHLETSENETICVDQLQPRGALHATAASWRSPPEGGATE